MKAIQVDVTGREMRLAKLLKDGHRDWDDMDQEDKLMLYECPFHLEGIVPEDDIQMFEHELELDGYFGAVRMARASVREGYGRLAGE